MSLYNHRADLHQPINCLVSTGIFLIGVNMLIEVCTFIKVYILILILICTPIEVYTQF